MSQNSRKFVQAVLAFDGVVQRTPADAWDNATPCEGWTARELVQHQCAVLNGVAAVASTGAMAAPSAPEDVSDPKATWCATRDSVLSALDQQGVLGQQGPFWFDSPTVDDMVGIVAWDPVTHAWDLAQAVGVHHGLDDALVQACHATVEPMSGMLVESGRTAAVLEAGADASVLDRYLALVGRQA